MSTTGTSPTSPTRTSPAVRTGTAFLAIQARLGVWLWSIVAVVAVVLAVLPNRQGGVEGSTWENVDQGPRWFLFAMALIMVTGYLPTHVANGMTRRSFTAALGVVMVVTSAGYAVLWTLGYALERLAFSARGWPHDLGPGHLGDGGLVRLGLEGLLVFAVYAASGTLVGATYYRGGGWWGTLTLPLTVGPVLVAEALVGGPASDGPLAGFLSGAPVTTAAAVLVLLALAAALGTAAHLMIRTVPIRTKVG